MEKASGATAAPTLSEGQRKARGDRRAPPLCPSVPVSLCPFSPMTKPVTAALSVFRDHLASKLATLPPESEELAMLLSTYERMQAISIAERIEEDLGNTYGQAREKLYATFIRLATLRERVAARNAREKAAILRKLEKEAREKAREAQRATQRATDPALRVRGPRSHAPRGTDTAPECPWSPSPSSPG
jgi:hypothetical protein